MNREMENIKKLWEAKAAIDEWDRNYKEGMEPLYKRPDWDTYYIDQLPQIGLRGTCNRGRSGCIIVSPDYRILMSGYVGAPPGMEHCDDVGHKFEWRLDNDPGSYNDYEAMEDDLHRHCVRTIHAEANAIYYAARKGVALEGAILYSTMTPCHRCAEAIVCSGIARVVTATRYPQPTETDKFFEKAGVELVTVGGDANYTA